MPAILREDVQRIIFRRHTLMKTLKVRAIAAVVSVVTFLLASGAAWSITK